ncbi:MAG TPA: polysaccharide biosynthesis C-terminal domain-containing protein [Candidatus Glassbacteria bacterium]|nr:polysaccharide biosynthesis C-terminal domain-containing protein [Candidatus Glassbacteria bacterium]
MAASSARTALIRFGTLAVQIPTSILIARLLGVEGKGVYTLLTVVPWLIAFVMLGGLDTAGTWLLSGWRATLRQIIALDVGILLVSSPLGIMLYLWIAAPQALAGVPAPLVHASALLIPLVLCRFLLFAILLGRERVVPFNLLYLVTSLLVLVLLTVIVGFLGAGTGGAIWAFIGAQALVLPLAAWWIPWRGSRPQRTATEPLSGARFLGKSLAYGLKGHLAGLLVTFNQRFDIFLLGALAGAREVGLYAVAVAVAETVWHVPISIQLNLFPRVSAIGAGEGALKMPRACRMTLLLTLILAVAIAVAGRPAISLLFGRDFLPAYMSLLALLPGVVAVSLAGVFESYFAGVDKRQYQSVSVGIAFTAGLLLCLLLIPRYGALGAAVASSVSYALQMVISLSLYARLAGFSPREFFIPRREDLAALATLAKDLFRS